MPARSSRPKHLDYARLHERVISFHDRVRTPDALAIYRKLLRDENPHALALFGRTALRYGQSAMAIKLLKRVLDYSPADGDTLNDLGLAYLDAGRLPEARGRFQDAAERNPEDFRAPLNVAVVLQQEGALDEALTQLQAVVASHPDQPAVALRLAELQLRRGEPRTALELLHGLRGSKLHPTWALALEAVAHAELGDEAAFQELMRYAEFVEWIEAEVPDGFPDLVHFNASLRKHLLRHRTLVKDPAGFSTRNGRHTLGSLLRDRTPVLEGMESAIQRAIERYAATLPPPDGHPFLHRADAFRIEAWAVVLGPGGYHEAHVHRDGWVSGVYYVSVPDAVRDDDSDCAGWLELGQGPAELHALGHPPWTQRVRPREGGFVLFPSFCWHRTLPFSAEGERLAVAFDAIPRI